MLWPSYLQMPFWMFMKWSLTLIPFQIVLKRIYLAFNTLDCFIISTYPRRVVSTCAWTAKKERGERKQTWSDTEMTEIFTRSFLNSESCCIIWLSTCLHMSQDNKIAEWWHTLHLTEGLMPSNLMSGHVEISEASLWLCMILWWHHLFSLNGILYTTKYQTTSNNSKSQTRLQYINNVQVKLGISCMVWTPFLTWFLRCTTHFRVGPNFSSLMRHLSNHWTFGWFSVTSEIGVCRHKDDSSISTQAFSLFFPLCPRKNGKSQWKWNQDTLKKTWHIDRKHGGQAGRAVASVNLPVRCFLPLSLSLYFWF